MKESKEFKFDLTNASLDNMSFTQSIECLYIDPVEMLQSIYNELTDAGIPDFIAIPAAKKAFTLTRDSVTETLRKILDNQASIDEWGV